MGKNKPNTSAQEALSAFAKMVSSGVDDERINLLDACLAIAGTEYAQIDTAKYIATIERLASRVREISGNLFEASRIIRAISRVLFEEEGFRGNRSDYYDPRNSYINEVLDRRLGIPITLSVVYMEVARRAGVPLFGVGMPGHFLLKFYDVDGHQLLIDPYESGAIIDEKDCELRLRQIYGGQMSLQPADVPPFAFAQGGAPEKEYLQVVHKRQMLTRMLNNLKSIYLGARNFRKALTVVDLILAIYPRSPEDVKHRALLRYNLGQMKGSADDFDDYLKMSPEASDADEIRQLALSIRRTLASLN